MGKPSKAAHAQSAGRPKPVSKTANRAIAKKSGSAPSAHSKPATSSAAPPPGSKKRPRKAGGGGGGNINGVQITHYEQQRLDRIREKDERKAKKEEKILLRKKERTKKLKILTKKNRKGQPVMGGRMELLLEKIQQSCAR